MNVIVSNKYKDLLNSLNYEISKNINGEFEVDEIINTFSNFYFNRMFLDITAIKDYQNLYNIQKLSINLDMSKVILLLDNNDFCSSPQFISQLVGMGIYNFSKDLTGIMYLYEHPNVYRDVAHLHNINIVNNNTGVVNNNVNATQSNVTNTQSNYNNQKRSIVIGFKNLTTHAGSTTLVYMLKKVLSKYYSVKAAEVNKRDFMYFREENMFSLSSSELNQFVSQNDDSNIILLDINDGDITVCTDIIFLAEPSVIKLNKLIMLDKNAFKKKSDKKIVLNKSFLNNSDISGFEREAEIKVFYNMPNLDDRNIDENLLLDFINKLGLLQRV